MTRLHQDIVEFYTDDEVAETIPANRFLDGGTGQAFHDGPEWQALYEKLWSRGGGQPVDPSMLTEQEIEAINKAWSVENGIFQFEQYAADADQGNDDRR